MSQASDETAREVSLPASTLAALAEALRSGTGELEAIHALYTAGFEAGDAFYDRFAEDAGDDPSGLPPHEFWRLLGAFLERRGWGSLTHTTPHAGVGMLSSRDWAEALGGDSSKPSCSFSAGLLACLLTRAAGGPLAVLEVACRAGGDGECAFVFGSEVTVHDLYGLLLEDRGLEDALAAL